MSTTEQGGSPVSPRPDLAGQAEIQRHTVRVLMGAQILGAVSISLGVTVGAVAAVDISGSDAVGGAVLTATAGGAAIGSALLARIADSGGRRGSLGSGYLLAAVGALVAAVGVELGFWPVLLVGMLGFGIGSATGLAARFAAADLAEPDRRGRAVGTVLWAGTLGAVAGPNLAGPARDLTDRTAVSGNAGVFLTGAVLYAAAAVVVWSRLRPDPLVRARELIGAQAGRSSGTGWGIVWAIPAARFALVGVALLHLSMVAVMSMSPVHLDHGGADLQVIGLVISAHVAGMYLFSPVFGVLVDRWGSTRVLSAGAVISLAGALVCASADQHEPGVLGAGLVLIGLGWSAGLVAASALLVAAVAPEDRARAQGSADVSMNLAGAIGGLLAGGLMAAGSFAVLGVLVAAVLAPYLLASLRPGRAH
ncbi:MFS transporter [Sporichthya sp.]|uniref:MFS transporter n=1 Tax=Sporichthya sp. TaxID=65475 RepID=UPI0017EDC3BA|nr:MFS transporter [Sporichthya sp.]MBA3742912.1 MFS transporter [Sporichthya sp.]